VDNKKLLIKAIEGSVLYNPSEKIILKTLINLAVNYIASVDIINLHTITQLNKTVIYKNLTTLEEINIIKKIEQSGRRINTFKLNQEQLDYTLQAYQKLKKLIKRKKEDENSKKIR
jgi:DNA-binding transcriptional regulator GbsR (MarR family)